MKFKYCFYIFLLVFVSCNNKKTSSVKNNKINKSVDKEIVTKKPKTIVKPKVISDSLNNKNAVAFFTEYDKQHKATKVRFKTRLGDIIIKLYNDTPLHRANFLFLTEKGYFDTTCFHRVVPEFIIQGGDSENRSTSIFRNKYKQYLLPPEFRKNRKHKRGVIAQARDWEYNPEKKSTPFEFYFVLNRRGEHHLDNEHTVFGEVIKGMSVIDKISKLKTGKDEWPYDDVHIKAEIIE